MGRVDLVIRKAATTALMNHASPKEVQAWLKKEHGITVTASNLDYWKKHPVDDKTPTAKGTHEFTDGCTFSHPSDMPHKDGIRPAEVCGVAIGVFCNGSALMKKKCPNWSGAGRLI